MRLKAKHIKKLRGRLLNRRWLEKEQLRILNSLERWNNFESFQCSAFFRGEEKAEYNIGIYYKGVYKDRARLKYIKKRLDEQRSRTDTV